MNYSPGDIIVYEAPLAGPDNNNKGLGFDFPIDVIRPAPELEQVMGLGLIIDSDFEDASLSSSSDDAFPIASPPLLACRRSPRRPAPASPWAEYAPMRTPSPSLRAWTAGVVLHLPAPAVPSLPSTPIGGYDLPVYDDAESIAYDEHIFTRSPAPVLVGLGLGLPPFDDDDLIAVIPGLNSPAAPRMRALSLSPAHICNPSHAGLGLGFAVPGFDDAARIEVLGGLDSPSPVLAPVPMPPRPRMRRDAALHDPCLDDDNVATPASASSPAPTGAYAAPVFHAPHPRAVPMPFGRASVGLGFVDADGAPMCLEGASVLESPAARRTFLAVAHSPADVSPIAGYDSPFWGTYATAVTEEDRKTAQMRRALDARLPVIEEIVYETPGSL
ncbi:hypothetical protein EIP86_007181 [Pleurotus ostreatoroseus]|nr:hypothetical protein EIP86_007181 [Pleurotus ostreatoroseus]